ncbi:MAG: hypothetical protein ACI4BB_00870 [Coprococcus sp.]
MDKGNDSLKKDDKRYVRMVGRIMAFWLIVILILEIISWILMPRTGFHRGGMMNYRARGFYGESENSLDVVAIGNSDLSSAFSPMEIWEQNGISAYACGEIKQQIAQAVKLLEEVLTCQKPKVVILEVDSLFQESMSGQLLSMLKTGIKYVFPVIEYHDRWKELNIQDLLGRERKSWHDFQKGYYYSDEKVAYTGTDYMKDTGEVVQIDAVAVHWLDKFLNICSQADIQVVMVEMPSANSWNMGRHEAVAAYAGQKGVPFIDFNLNMDKTGFDWMTDSRDGGNHLNYSGARKISVWLGNYLQENYDLADHRTDAAYAEWQHDMEQYKNR